jgi:hypothetical protein
MLKGTESFSVSTSVSGSARPSDGLTSLKQESTQAPSLLGNVDDNVQIKDRRIAGFMDILWMSKFYFFIFYFHLKYD